MLGTELPVCAISNDYPALEELLPNGKYHIDYSSNKLFMTAITYGGHFENSNDLCAMLVDYLRNFPNSPKLSQFRKNIHNAKRIGWQENWMENAAPVFSK